MTHAFHRDAADPLARWIDDVHELLAGGATELAAAAWGPVGLRHRSVRPDWFAVYDRAWARVGAATAEIDLVTGAIGDVAGRFDAPPGRVGGEPEGVFLTRSSDHDGVVAWNAHTGRAVHLRHGPPDDYDSVSPLRPLVHWSATERDGALVHAAVVGRAQRPGGPVRGLLLVGDAGFGKSTSTLACLERGWVTCGDDAVALFEHPDGWHAEAVYGAVKTKIDAAHAVPEGLDVRSWTVGNRKWIHRLTGTDAGRLVAEMAIDAVVVLRPTGDVEAPVREVGAAAARTAAAPSTIASMPDRQHRVLRTIGRVCHDLPAFELPRRADLARTVADLHEVLVACEPRVSVVIPVHNGADFVADAIASVVAQDVGRCEIVVVDDASTDGSRAVIDGARSSTEQAGHQLVTVHNATNLGVAATRNRGIAMARAELVGFLDQDDLWRTDHIAVLDHAMRSRDADAAFGRVAFTDLGADRQRPWLRERWFDGDHPGHVPGSALVRRRVFEEVGVLDEAAGAFDDVDWYMRVRDSDCPVATVDHVVLERRVHDANDSQRLARHSDELLAVVRGHLARTHARGPASTPIALDVVIPVHNGTSYLREAVRSALDQEGTDVRVVVVDDGSTDGVAAEVASWAEPRVTLVRHDARRGIAAARNRGAVVADRDWLAFLDADDRWPLDRTRRLAEQVADGAFAIAVGRVAAGADLDACATSPADHLPRALLAGGILCRRSTFERVGAFDESLRVGEFVEWMARARRMGIEERAVPVVSLLRRVHDANTTRTHRHQFDDYLRVVAKSRARAAN
jgi:glycosyltransferase involved in cell wall biosynthesis